MDSYSALRHVSIGQYVPGDTPIHSLDPRGKLVAFLLLVVATVLATGYLPNAVLLLAILGLVHVARLPLRYLMSTVRPALPWP